MLVLVSTRNPFLPQDAWKLYVRVGSLLLAALASVLTHFSLSMALRYGDVLTADTQTPGLDADLALSRGLSYAVFAGCILLMCTLAVGFGWSAAQGARLDRRLLRLKAAVPRHRLPLVRVPDGDRHSHSGWQRSRVRSGGYA